MTTLELYELWLANQNQPTAQRLMLWEIGKELNINKSAIRDAQSDSSADRLVGRNVLAATVSRYVKQARAMIDNTALGKFPIA